MIYQRWLKIIITFIKNYVIDEYTSSRWRWLYWKHTIIELDKTGYLIQVVIGIRKEFGVFGNDYDTVDGTGVR
jgi:hypothetical protein